MKIIALGYQDNVGKDTFCKFLKMYLRIKNYRVEDLAFADSLKEICYTLYSWAGLKTGDFYELNVAAKDQKLPLLNETPRQLWIRIAEKLRESDKNVFVNAAIRKDNTKLDFLILRDCRKLVEMKAIEESGCHYVTVRITRPNHKNPENVYDLANYKFKRTVHNDGTMKQLNTKAMTVCDEIIKGEI